MDEAVSVQLWHWHTGEVPISDLMDLEQTLGQELVAVEHGARQLPLLHQHGGDPVSVRDARKMLIIDPVYFLSQCNTFSLHGTRNISFGKIKQTT